MDNRDVLQRFVIAALAVLALSACSKKEEAAPAVQEDAVTAAQYPDAAAPLQCHPQLQKLVNVLPAKAEIDGQKITGRECRSGMASVTYGNGEPVLVRFELTALQYPETDLEPLGPKSGQELLDNLRKTMEVKYTVLESQLKTAEVSGAGGAINPSQHAQLPREITLPNGAKAMVATEDGSNWELDSVLSERHMLVITWADTRKSSNADEAVAALGRLAGEVHYERLK